MTQLLVSVRDVEEARAALLGGADIIDIKEPSNGSLGAADLQTIIAIADEVSEVLPVSVALGELQELDPALVDALPHSILFAKTGLKGCLEDDYWQTRLQNAWRYLPPMVGRVAVAYADWQQAKSPNPLDIIAAGKALGGSHFLLDTSSKSKPVLDLVGLDELNRWFDFARQSELQIAIAGSLAGRTFEQAIDSFAPEIIAVRGAACDGDRTQQVSELRVRELKMLVEKEHPVTPTEFE